MFGTVAMSYEVSGSEINFNGSAEIVGGTGAYRGITAHNLSAFDHNTLDGQIGHLHARGLRPLLTDAGGSM